ncbi:MAG: cellulase family glycosylhydrolase [Fibrobacter sp.]|nr:cellulase family glycosylhydrolase [Fibrobacter sp.]
MSIKTKVFGLVVLASAVAFAGPVSHFGKLVACGTNICGEKTGTSTPIQLKGPSLYWSTGSPAAMWNPIAVDWFVTNFNIGVIRAPMAIKYYKENSAPISETDGNPGVTSYGYLSTSPSGSPGVYKSWSKAKVKQIVDQAVIDDIYVIVDWHSHNAGSETSEAANFFKEMAAEYKDVPNIIWEIYNEPVSDNASTINNYAKTVVAAIRGTGNENLVVVGTNWYSSKPSEQESQGLHNTYSNIAYTLHFYTGQDGHSSYLSNKAKSNPTFVTEWGATDASGDGTVKDFSSYLSWMDNNKVSGCMWFAGNDGQTSAMFPAAATAITLDNYKSRFSGTSTTAGVFNEFMKTNPWTTFVPSSHPQGKTISASVSEGQSKVFSTELGIKGAISAATASVGTVTKTDNSITYQSANNSPENASISYTVTQGGVTIQERIILKIVDRKPVIKDTAISVSYKGTSVLTLSGRLGVENPISQEANSMRVTQASVSSGSVTFSGDTIVFTPSGEPGLVTLNLSASNANGASSGNITLVCENQAPSVYAKTFKGKVENTSPVSVGVDEVKGSDADGDELTFSVAYLDPRYPGTVALNDTKDMIIYTPDGQTTGTVYILFALTDGNLDSKVASVYFNLSGNGTPISVTPPKTIPAEIYTPPVSIMPKAKAVAAGMHLYKDEIHLGVATPGAVRVEVFDLQGHRVATVLNKKLSAGEHSVAWNSAEYPMGVYIVRMKQGSTVKSLRFVKK